jgi:hypothetical protein
MTLCEIINSLDRLDQDETICAVEPWSCKTVATIALEPENGQLPEVAAQRGMQYVLEVSVAKEFLDAYGQAWVDPEVKCERLIEYARNDA